MQLYIHTDDAPNSKLGAHATLNPLLYSNGVLKLPVREKLLADAKKFKAFLDVPDLDIADVILTGSNASYNYTDNSDIDVHLLVDFDKLPFKSIAESYFLAEKQVWNDKYQARIYGMPVEFYVQDLNQTKDPLVANGIYSLTENKWGKRPRTLADVDQNAVTLKYNYYKDRIDKLLENPHSVSDIDDLGDRIYDLRQSGLKQGGELSVENVVFKQLRTNGDLQRLDREKQQLSNKELSLDTRDQFPIAMGKLLTEYRKKMKKSMRSGPRGVNIFDAWEEEKHPRGQPHNAGQFVKVGGSVKNLTTAPESGTPSSRSETRKGEEGGKGSEQRGSAGVNTEEQPASYERRSVGVRAGNGVRSDGVPVRAIYTPTGDEDGLGTTFHELDPGSGKYFNKYIQAAKQGKYSACVNVYPAEDYDSMNTYLTPDGGAGFALKDGDDIVSVFRHPNAPKNAAEGILNLSVQRGGKRLDCFDTILPGLYAQHGFRAVARIPFNDEYKPDGWDYDTFKKYNEGRPDVVFMVYDPEHKKPYQPGDGVKVEDYDEAEKIQRAETAKIWNKQDKPDKPYHMQAKENPNTPEPSKDSKTKDSRFRFLHIYTYDGVFKIALTRLRDAAAAFKEEEHPRGQPGNAGEFVSKGKQVQQLSNG